MKTSVEQLKSIFYRLKIIKQRIDTFKISEDEKAIAFNNAIKDIIQSTKWIDNPITAEFFVTLINYELEK